VKIEARDAGSALQDLSKAGFTHDVRSRNGTLVDVSTGVPVDPSNLRVVKTLRFEAEPGLGDASNVYALDVAEAMARGFLVDALDFEGDGGPPAQIDRLRAGPVDLRTDDATEESHRYGLRKVTKSVFDQSPEHYVLRIGYPDFPECPFGQGFTMLGFDLASQEYVWLATNIVKDDRLQRVSYARSKDKT
jgi:hypothetical protein